MRAALMEKLQWVLTLIGIYSRGGITSAEVAGSTIPHALLGMALFIIIAFFNTREQLHPERASDRGYQLARGSAKRVPTRTRL